MTKLLSRIINNSLNRSYSTSPSSAVQLAYMKRQSKSPAEVSSTPPLVILHGLFGSKQNWKSLSGAFANKLNVDVFALDLRNHGESPHSPTHNYEAMAEDVYAFLREHNLKGAVLMGHSMGGKVAMSLALSKNSIISKLIVVDVAPIPGPLSADFQMYVNAMKEIASHIKQTSGQDSVTFKKSDADAMLGKYEKDFAIRQFLLTNLVRENNNGQQMSFRVPLDIIGDSLGDIGNFPHDPETERYDGPTLFIRGKHSDYIKDQYFNTLRKLFPQYKLEELPTGHWVHAEKPTEFLEIASEFIISS